jgi:hypothetical protein
MHSLSQDRLHRYTVWKRRCALTALVLIGAVMIMAFRLVEYADYLASAARV